MRVFLDLALAALLGWAQPVAAQSKAATPVVPVASVVSGIFATVQTPAPAAQPLGPALQPALGTALSPSLLSLLPLPAVLVLPQAAEDPAVQPLDPAGRRADDDKSLERLQTDAAIPFDAGSLRSSALESDAKPVVLDLAVQPNGNRGPPAVPRTVRVAPPLSKKTRSQLAQLSQLDKAQFTRLSKSLAHTAFNIPGALPFSEDTTFSLEVEFEVAPQIARETRKGGGYGDESRRLVKRLRSAIPKWWGLKKEGGGDDLREFQTRNAGGVYHANTAKDWQELKQGLAQAQELLPGGLKSVHIHIGRKHGSRNGVIKVEPQRFGVLMKVYESMWASMAGYGYGPFHGDDDRAYGTDILSNNNWSPDGYSPIFDHGRWINLSDEFPTIEYKIAKGLLRTPGRGPKHLSVARLQEDLWWTFALFEHLMTYRRTLPLAALGLPLEAGEKPSRKRLATFLDLVYGQDVVGKAIALKRFAETARRKSRRDQQSRVERRADVRARYEKMGLAVVYDLHDKHGGFDEKLAEHLQAGGGKLLTALARDLVRARGGGETALGYFPESLHDALRRSMVEATPPPLAARIQDALGSRSASEDIPHDMTGWIVALFGLLALAAILWFTFPL